MKPLSAIVPAAALLAATFSTGHAAIENLIRADFRNDTGPLSNAVGMNPGVVAYGGHVSQTDTHTALENGGVKYELRESSFGQPVATWQPSADFVTQTLATVNAALYPDEGLTRSQMQVSTAALRAKFLTYGDDPNDGSPAIVNLFEQTFRAVQDDNTNPWFGAADRTKIQEQIAILRDALASAPTDFRLRHLLLDVYYDWATIEMQFARKYMAQIAAVRIGEVNGTNPFVIDDEITLQRRLAAIADQVIRSYGEFLTTSGAVEPADFDSRVTAGQRLGQYIFVHEQPMRAQSAARYATAGGGLSSVSGPASAGFTGYKDYRTLLTVVGRFLQHKTDLARLLGLRNSPNDLTEARRVLGEVQSVVSAFQVYRGLFPGVDFNSPNLAATGVLGALATITSAQVDATGLRNYLNGTSNLLGLDPNFLLLLPADTSPAGLSDSYDLYRSRVFNNANPSIPTGPLGVAKARMNEAKNAFHTFVESAELTQSAYEDLEGDFKSRFREITGYDYDAESDQYRVGPKPGTPSELATIERNFLSLHSQIATLQLDAALIENSLVAARETLRLQEDRPGLIRDAYANYFTNTTSAWDEIHYQSGLAVATQVAADGALEAASADGATTLFSAGANIAVIAGVTAANAAVQHDAAVTISRRTQEIENQELLLNQALAQIEGPIATNGAKTALFGVQREALANAQAIADKKIEIAQAVADAAALLLEVQRLRDDATSGRSSLARSHFADPIHYLRAERELIRADREFRNAQRWVFFALRALEYKWQERFAISTGGEAWDAGSVFRMRNADELVELLQKMEEFDTLREANAGTRVTTTEVISLRDHIFSPNPDDPNLTFSSLIPDKGIRYFGQNREVLSTVAHFRAVLRRDMQNNSDPISVQFDTSTLHRLGSFFAEGNYRDKVLWTAVNIIGSDAPAVPLLNGKQGRLGYSGNTYFRRRVPLCKTTLQPGQVQGSDAYTPSRDFPAGLMIAPFRYFVDTNFTNTFESFDHMEANGLKFAYSSRSAAEDPALLARLSDSGNGFQSYHFGELSVAATQWTLQINGGQVNLNNVQDIELIVVHRARARAQILPCP